MKRAVSILLAALLLLFALPTFAEEKVLQPGLYASDTGSAILYLDEKGAGVLNYVANGLYKSCGAVWTGDSLEIERVAIPFAAVDDVLFFTFADEVRTLRYVGPKDEYKLGDRENTAFAGTYISEDGRQLVLSADGQGVYTGANGAEKVFWGSLVPYWTGSENLSDTDCFVLFGSWLSALDFVDGGAVVEFEDEGKVAFYAQSQEPQAEPVQGPAGVTLVSAAFDIALTVPADDWIVEETEGGLLLSLRRDLVQYTFLTLPLEKEPTAATLDLYADHIWNDSLMNAGVAYDAQDTVREDFLLGEVTGRRLATEWTQDEAVIKGDSALWYADGRLYVALCVSNEATRPDALALLDQILATLRSAESLERSNQLPVDRDVFEGIRELAPAPEVTEELYYAYRMSDGDQTVDMIPFLSAMGFDPASFTLTIRSDGTGRLEMLGEGTEFVWDEQTFTAEGLSVPYVREGDHILMTMESESIDFAPAAEMEPLLAEAKAATGTTESQPEPAEPVAPTPETLVGSWTFTKAKAMGLEIPAATMGTTMSLVLNEDGTAVLLTDGSPTELDWSLKEDGTVALTVADMEVFTLTHDGATLALNTGAEGVEMVFEKDA